MIRNCEICGGVFKTYPSINQKCCSRLCSDEFKKIKSYIRYKKICEVCGEVFLPPRQAEGGKYCSYACSGKSCRIGLIDRAGYWYCYVPEHPNCTKQGYYAEHRLIVESSIGRYLTDTEEIHHIDHDKKNNVIDNLRIMSKSEHSSYHMKQNHIDGKIWTDEFRKNVESRRQKNGRLGKFTRL